MPRIVESPEPKVCSHALLARTSPWVGSVRERIATTIAEEGSPRVAEQWVLCGSLDRDACITWGERIGAVRAARERLSVEVRPGRRLVGKFWTFAHRDGLESRLFPTNAAAAAFLEARGESVLTTAPSRRDAFEPRDYRVDLVYRAPRLEQPAVEWEWELPATSSAIAEAHLAIEDLADRGITLVEPRPWDLGARLHEALQLARRTSPDPMVQTPLRIRVMLACDSRF